MRSLSTLVYTVCALAALTLASSHASAAFTDYFDDAYTGPDVNSDLFAPSSFVTDATNANPLVSGYTVHAGRIGYFNVVPTLGNPIPAINMFGGSDTVSGAYLNLTTVAGATYSVAYDTAQWTGSPTTFDITVSAFNGADTPSGTALGSATTTTGALTNNSFTFVALSTATTLYLHGSSIADPVADVYLDNLNIDQDLSTVAVPTPAALPAGLALLGVAAMRRRR